MKMHRARPRVAPLVVLLFLAAGCGSSSDDSPAADDGPTTPGALTGRLTVTLGGAVSFHYDEETDLSITQVADAGPGSRLAFGNSVAPISAGDVFFTVAFDLFGVYEGAGAYEIPVTGEPALPEPGEPDAESFDPAELIYQQSRATVTYAPVEEDEAEGREQPTGGRTFDQAHQPCTVEVGEQARTGRLECPELADTDGASISVSMEWAVT